LSSFSFFQPNYFWGLIVLALPVIIHLLGRKRAVKIDFSTLRFFKATALRAHRTRRLKRFLLLLSRLLLLAMIVLAFSHPFDARDPLAVLTNPDADVYFWVDLTKSMDYAEKGVPLWRTATALADSIERKMPPSARKYRWDETRNKFTADGGLRQVKAPFTRYGPPGCRAMVAAFREEALHSSRPAALVILSDFQENVGRTLDSVFQGDTMKSPVICISCRPPRPWNFGILRAVSSGERPPMVTSTVAACGKNAGSGELSVFLGDMRVGSARINMTPDSGTTATMEIAGGGILQGGYVRLDANDPFPLDNLRFFVLGSKKSLRVLVIGDSLLSFPVAAAFRAIGPSPWNPVIMRSPRQLGIGDIDSADLIICDQIASDVHPLRLLRTTRLFGPKAIIISPAIDSEALREAELVTIANGNAPKPGLVVMGKPCGMVLYDTLSSLWKGFPSLRQGDAAIFRAIGPLPGAALCGMENRMHFATHLLDSLGHSWVFLASPLGRNPANNLCETGFFVPFLDRIARFAMESIHKSNEEWFAGRPRRNPFLGSRNPAAVFTARGDRYSAWGSQLNVTFDEPGVYRIAPHDEPSFWVAVNPDPEEIRLVFHSPTTWEKRGRLLVAAEGDEFLATLQAGRGFVFSYGPWILIAVLLAIETLLWERNEDRRKEYPRRKE
jgi:hypothetical protein